MVMFLVMLILSVGVFANIEDRIKFLKPDELEVMQKRVVAFKKDF